jgi:hypothetical protein
MKMKFLILAMALALASGARAQLKFEQSEIELHPTVSDQNAVAHFKYKNTGSKPIHINSVNTSCGCTVATLKSNDVPVGESGEITATLNFGGHSGLLTKTVTVTTDDANQPQTILTLKAKIPMLLQIQPVFVWWKQDEEAKPKTITVTADADAPVKKINVISSDPEIAAKVEAGSGPKEWKIDVSPKDMKKLHNATLTITPDYPTNTPKVFMATARVIAPVGN